MDSICWVVSRDCNQRGRHCYNNSEPGAPGLTLAQVSTCDANLPDPEDVIVGRVILSGGEVLVWPELLLHTLSCLHERYGERAQLMVQTNGDLLDEVTLDRLLAALVQRIDVSGMDQYHPKSTRRRHDYIEQLFTSRGMVEAGTVAATTGGDSGAGAPIVDAFWGATEGRRIAPLWPRGRAQHPVYRALNEGCPRQLVSIWESAKKKASVGAVSSAITVCDATSPSSSMRLSCGIMAL